MKRYLAGVSRAAASLFLLFAAIILLPTVVQVHPAWADFSSGALKGVVSTTGQLESLTSTNGALDVNAANPSYHNPTLGVAEVGNGGAVYFDDNIAIGSHQVRTGPGRLVRYMSAGSSVATIAFYDDADGTCSSGQMTGVIPLTTTDGYPAEMGLDFTNGLCVLIAGDALSELTLVLVP